MTKVMVGCGTPISLVGHPFQITKNKHIIYDEKSIVSSFCDERFPTKMSKGYFFFVILLKYTVAGESN